VTRGEKGQVPKYLRDRLNFKALNEWKEEGRWGGGKLENGFADK